jgi:hypothetical protein
MAFYLRLGVSANDWKSVEFTLVAEGAAEKKVILFGHRILDENGF